MNSIEIMKRIIDDCGKREFTHKEIINWTNTNCPYGVLRQLKNYYEIDYVTKENQNTSKKYRKYIIIKRKEKDVKKPSIR